MRYLAVLMILTLVLSCKTRIAQKGSSSFRVNSDSDIAAGEPSNEKISYKGDTAYVYDEKLAWEPFSQERSDLETIRKTYPETKRELNYNDNSEFNDTLITYNSKDNEVTIYANEEEKNFRHLRIKSNDGIHFNGNIAIGRPIHTFLKNPDAAVEVRKISTIIICPDEDELQEIILHIDGTNSIHEIDFYGYYD